MGGRDRILQLQLDRRTAEVDQLRRALAEEAKRVAARDHEIVRWKALASWRAAKVEVIALAIGAGAGFLAGFVVFAQRVAS